MKKNRKECKREGRKKREEREQCICKGRIGREENKKRTKMERGREKEAGEERRKREK